MLQGSPLFLVADRLERYGALSDRDRQAILMLPYRVRSCTRTPWAVREGEQRSACLVMLSGLSCQSNMLPLGVRQITSFHFPGDLIGMPVTGRPFAQQSLEIIGQAELAEIARADLLRLAEDRPAVARALWADAAAAGAVTREWLINVGRRNARGRVLYLLCELGLRYEEQGIGTRDDFVLPLTKTHLADATGLTPVHVNRVLQALSAERKLWRSGRRVRIMDWNAIVASEAFDFGHLQERSAGPAPGGADAPLRMAMSF